MSSGSLSGSVSSIPTSLSATLSQSSSASSFSGNVSSTSPLSAIASSSSAVSLSVSTASESSEIADLSSVFLSSITATSTLSSSINLVTDPGPSRTAEPAEPAPSASIDPPAEESATSLPSTASSMSLSAAPSRPGNEAPAESSPAPSSTSQSSSSQSSSAPTSTAPSSEETSVASPTSPSATTTSSEVATSGNAGSSATSSQASVEENQSSNASSSSSEGNTAGSSEVPASGGASTSVRIVQASNSAPQQLTSTFTDRPSSTFSSLVGGVTLTPSDGQSGPLSVSFPGIVTIFSTSTGPDGSEMTVKTIVANPTGIVGGVSGDSGSSFFEDTGKVAGVFVVVGIVIASVFMWLFFFCKRRMRRRRAQRRWRSYVRDEDRHNPFSDPPQTPHTPEMRATPRQLVPVTPIPFSPPGLATTTVNDRPMINSIAERDEGDSHRSPAPNSQDPFRQHEIGLAITTADDIRSAQSTPSLYPPSIDDKDDQFESIHLGEPSPAPPGLMSEVGPPRPPRSHLRDSASKYPIRTVYPLTPSPTSSGHSRTPSESMSGPAVPFPADRSDEVKRIASHDEILSRKTLLGVQRRPSQTN